MRKAHITSILSLATVLMLSQGPVMAADGIINIGDLPGGPVQTYSNALTNTGSVIVGYGQDGTGWKAFRWTSAGGLVNLGDLPGGGTNSYAYDVSADGNTIVGWGSGVNGWEAFIWTQAGGMVGLGDVAGGTIYSGAAAISADGLTVIGGSNTANGYEAATWTQAGGWVTYGDLPGGGFNSWFYGATLSANILVGYGQSAAGYEAMYWSQATGMVGLGDLPGGTVNSYLQAASDDGRVMGGAGESASGTEAIRWTAEDGMVGLGDLPGGAFNSYVFTISGDGRVIGGSGTTALGYEAFLWTEEDGMVKLSDWLVGNGIALTGWNLLRYIGGINYNGSIITGIGVTAAGEETFIATVGGLITAADVASSLASTQNVPQIGNQITNLAMHGAHHRTLDETGVVGKNGNCMWANADAAHYTRHDAKAHLAEVGVCRDFASDTVRAGIGIGKSQSRQDLVLFGDVETNGEYAVAEASWRIPDTNLTASVTGIAGTWDADVKRGYMNAGNLDTSRGSTDLESQSVRFRLKARNVAEVAGIGISPRIEYTLTRTKMDGYTETTGGFPARFDDQEVYAHEARIGVTAEKDVTEKTRVGVTLEGIRRFDDETAKSSGEVIGIFSFNEQGRDIQQTWGRLGVDVDHRISENSVVSASVHAATRGEDPEASASITYRRSFSTPE